MVAFTQLNKKNGFTSQTEEDEAEPESIKEIETKDEEIIQPEEESGEKIAHINKQLQEQTGLGEKKVEAALEESEGMVNKPSGKVRTYGMNLKGDHGYVWNVSKIIYPGRRLQ